ncbi:MAG: SDR family oxidoreductase [Spirochaetia bacterium]|jgi:NAD(P)-dependent dehydrogenase (short-subunit alcohol dehydrogenase family)|nr:SDR family oxidoreductase [Spirochaetia bacterium]
MEYILITGVTGLLGKEFVNFFLTNNYKVIGIFRNKEKFDSLFKKSDSLIGLEINLEQDNAIDTIIEYLEKHNIFPQYLVNNATNAEYHRVESNGFTLRENMINHYIINVIIPYELSFKIMTHKKSRLKKIVNISSMYGVIPYNPCLYNNPLTETPLQYSIAKSAMIHLTKELAIRFANENINVNSISYGGVDGRVDEIFKEKFAKITPLKRMMQPAEVVGALNFLLSDASNYMTGHNLIVDGGRTVW